MAEATIQNSGPFMYKAMDSVRYYYYDVWNELGDPRVRNYPFMDGGPWTTILGVLIYLYIVKYGGRQLMKNQKPFELKSMIFIYNLVLVSINGYFVYNGALLTNFGLDSWKCERVNRSSTNLKDLEKIFVGWLFFMTKFVDFCDTFFFVLRKRDRQLSGLHVFHHSCMPIFCWIGLKFVPGGNSAFFPLLNSLVHTVMYTYYALSTFENLKPYLWWKKYITQMQMIQFVLVIAHSIYSMVIPQCEWPKVFMYLSIFNAFVFFCLFYSFFRSTYTKSSNNKAEQKKVE